MSAAEVVSAEPTLEELAATANRAHDEAVRHGTAMLHSAIACGEALVTARRQVEGGQWQRWLGEHCPQIAYNTARGYCRVAQLKDQIPHEVTSVKGALRHLRFVDADAGDNGAGNRDRRRHSQEVVDEAFWLRDTGMTNKAIGEMLGVGEETIGRWFNPALQERNRERSRRRNRELAEARERARRERRDASMKRIGGTVAHSYSRLRTTLDEMQRAHDEAEGQVKAALGSAMAKLHAAEDEIVKALGIE